MWSDLLENRLYTYLEQFGVAGVVAITSAELLIIRPLLAARPNLGKEVENLNPTMGFGCGPDGVMHFAKNACEKHDVGFAAKQFMDDTFTKVWPGTW